VYDPASDNFEKLHLETDSVELHAVYDPASDNFEKLHLETDSGSQRSKFTFSEAPISSLEGKVKL